MKDHQRLTRHSLFGPVARVWLVVAVFAFVTLLRSWQVGIPLRDPGGDILLHRVLLTTGLFVVLMLVDGVRRTSPGQRRRPAAVRTAIRARWTRARLLLAASALLAYHLVYFCYHNLKSWDVFNAPRDQMLLAWDHWLFLGHDPAVLLHHLLGQHLAAYALVVVYESFATLVSVAFVAAVVLPDRMRDSYAFIAALICVWILGVATYYAIPSLGPFHSAPHDFLGLPHTIVQETQARYMSQRAHLLAAPHDSDAFAQVSAFASLHVAVTTVLVLMTRHLKLTRTSRALSLFLVATIVATVYLGWHFAVDDLAGLTIATLSVAAGLRLAGARPPSHSTRPPADAQATATGTASIGAPGARQVEQ